MGRDAIQLIWSEDQDELIQSIMDWLESEFGPVCPVHDRLATVQSRVSLATNSAIVLVSDGAAADSAWQHTVRSLSEDVRVIPVGSFETADCNDPDAVPPRVAEINFISVDEHLLENLRDALLTPADFYELRNSVMVSAAAWEAAGRSDDALMPGLRATSRALRKTREKRRLETDPLFDEQLSYMEKFLDESRRHNKRVLLARLPNAIRMTTSVIVVIAGIVTLFMMLPMLRWAAHSNVSLAIEPTRQLASVTAIKALDGVINPLTTAYTRQELYDEMIACLDMNWINTPIGNGYRWALNDVALTNSPRYLWSADEDGAVALWDTHTGEIVDHLPLSDESVSAVGIDANGGLMAAVDGTGTFFLKAGDGDWQASGDSCELLYPGSADIEISNDGHAIVVTDGSALSLYGVDGSEATLLHAETFDDVLAVDPGSDGRWIVYDREEDGLHARTYDGPKLEEDATLPVAPHKTCYADAQDGLLLFADASGRILIRERDGSISPTGVTLQSPMFLSLRDDGLFAYHDRNAGTHLYDRANGIDLGTCLDGAAAPTWLDLNANTVAVCSNNLYMTQDISTYLPSRTVELTNAQEFFGTSDTEGGSIIRSVEVKNGCIVEMSQVVDGVEDTVIIDGARMSSVGPAQFDEGYRVGVANGASYYPTLQTAFNGTITLAGITRQVEGGADAVVLGTSDGRYYELIFSSNGDVSIAASKILPNRAPVEAVVLDDDACYIRDAEGLYWPVRLGVRSGDVNGLFNQFKGKLTEAFYDDMFDAISDNTADFLDLKRAPGADGQVWE